MHVANIVKYCFRTFPFIHHDVVFCQLAGPVCHWSLQLFLLYVFFFYPVLMSSIYVMFNFNLSILMFLFSSLSGFPFPLGLNWKVFFDYISEITSQTHTHTFLTFLSQFNFLDFPVLAIHQAFLVVCLPSESRSYMTSFASWFFYSFIF